MPRQHYYPDVPKLGNIALTRHAQARLDEEGITDEQFYKVLAAPSKQAQEGFDIQWHEGNGFRIVILLNPTPATGAKLVKTVYRVAAQARAKG